MYLASVVLIFVISQIKQVLRGHIDWLIKNPLARKFETASHG
jgi:hypothetical protein